MGGVNTYAYANNNPTFYVDKFGLRGLGGLAEHLAKLAAEKQLKHDAVEHMSEQMGNEIDHANQQIDRIDDAIDSLRREKEDCKEEKKQDPCFDLKRCLEKCFNDFWDPVSDWLDVRRRHERMIDKWARPW